MAIITEHLQLNKQFLIIDSPVPFSLIANNGTDEVYRMAGAWQIDTHKLLPEKYQKQYPVFNLDLVYDDTNLGGQTVTVRESNIDIGDGISGVNGQDVRVTNYPLNQRITNELDSNDNKIPLEVNVQGLQETQKITNELDSNDKKVPLEVNISAFNFDNDDVDVFYQKVSNTANLLANINGVMNSKFDNKISEVIAAINDLKKKIISSYGGNYADFITDLKSKIQNYFYDIELYDGTIVQGIYCNILRLYHTSTDKIINNIRFQNNVPDGSSIVGISINNNNELEVLCFNDFAKDKPVKITFNSLNINGIQLEY